MHVSTLIATLVASDAEGARRVDDTGATTRLVDGLRARFRRGNHRLGHNPQRQWSMTTAPVTGPLATGTTTGRTDEDVRRRERNPLIPHPRQGFPG